MINPINGIEDDPLYPATIEGDFEIKIITENVDSYDVKVWGLTTLNFDCTIPFAFAQDSNGDFDAELAFNWLKDELVDAVSINSGSTSYAGQLTADFQQLNQETDKYESSLEGDYELEVIDEDSTHYTLRFRGIGNEFFDFKIIKGDPAVSKGIDPKKVLLWLLKKMKEALCPECQ